MADRPAEPVPPSRRGPDPQPEHRPTGVAASPWKRLRARVQGSWHRSLRWLRTRKFDRALAVAIAGLFALGALSAIEAFLRPRDESSLLVASGTLILAGFAALQIRRDAEANRGREISRLVELATYATLAARSVAITIESSNYTDARYWAVESTMHSERLQAQMLRVAILGARDRRLGPWATEAFFAYLDVADELNELARRYERTALNFVDMEDDDLRASATVKLRSLERLLNSVRVQAASRF